MCDEAYFKHGMRQLMILLGLIGFALRGSAQSLVLPDMGFLMTFSGASNSAAAFGLSGQANYFRLVPAPPYIPHFPTYTNRFDAFIASPVQPEAVWILEKTGDGSLALVGAATNIYPSEYYGFVIQQSFTLTTNQVHSLLQGNWYAEVDYGDSNFVANIEPNYESARGPKAAIAFPPVFGNVIIQDSISVVSPNNRNIKYVLDGSHCADPFYLPIQCSWQGWPMDSFGDNLYFTNSGVLATNTFDIGSYIISLQASDVIASGEPFYFQLYVRTAGQVVRSMIGILQGAAVPAHQKKILNTVLAISATQFDQGHMAQGCAALELFKRLRGEFHLNKGVDYYSYEAQFVIDAVKNSPH